MAQPNNLNPTTQQGRGLAECRERVSPRERARGEVSFPFCPFQCHQNVFLNNHAPKRINAHVPCFISSKVPILLNLFPPLKSSPTWFLGRVKNYIFLPILIFRFFHTTLHRKSDTILNKNLSSLDRNGILKIFDLDICRVSIFKKTFSFTKTPS